VEATRPAEVPGVLASAEAAAARGLWVAGYVAYEAAPGLDPALVTRPPDPGLPLAWFAWFEGRQETALPEPPDDPPPGAGWTPTTDRATYDRAIATIHERIAAGDTYQVNHTLRLRARIDGDLRGLYRDLCYAQRGAYSAYLDTGRHRIASASPELFFRIDARGDGASDARTIATRPMKGTAPRGRWRQEDEAIRDALRGSVKDRAENAMIVDLLRNDLGRVARPGTVRWTDVFEAERYETVWQLTSTVEAGLAADADLPTIFRALFPCGSITGAPKASTMRIVAGLEDSPRGVYCGTIGYLAPPSGPGPRARFNVAIRTVVQDVATGVVEYGVGGGITWDSRAGAEYDETVAKARVLTARRPAFSLFESLCHDPETGYRRLEEHLTRLGDSAAFFGFVFDEAAARDALAREAARVPDRPSRVRLELDRRGRLTTGSVPMPRTPEPVRLAIDLADPVDPADVFLFHKTTRRARYEAAAARHPDADDAVLVNVDGEVTETCRANIAIRMHGRWITPPRGAGLLGGCERAALLADGTLEEATVTIGDLRAAKEIAYLNSVRGWHRAVLIDGSAVV
jgi:para-aminobenzoate synthetase/4-amino-4-deoxychorismate lyase